MKRKIYLAGSTRERDVKCADTTWKRWQSPFIALLPTTNYEFFNPASLNTKDFDTYSAIDIYHVKACDIVLGYVEDENPCPVGIATELGIAKGMEKFVILVNACTPEHPNYRYKKFMENAADVVFTNLDDALEFLRILKY